MAFLVFHYEIYIVECNFGVARKKRDISETGWWILMKLGKYMGNRHRFMSVKYGVDRINKSKVLRY